MNISKEITKKYINNIEIIPGTKIGKNPTIGSFVILGTPAIIPTKPLEIGDNPIIRSHTIIYAGNEIGDNFQTGHGTFIQENNRIGDSVSIGTQSVILSHCLIEKEVRIHTQVFIAEYSIIMRKVWIGPNVVLTNTKHPTCSFAKQCLKNTYVKLESNTIIGANSTILPGVTVKEGAIVGVGSVVVKDVEKNEVVIGNPARKIKDRKDIKCITGLTKYPYIEE